MCVYMHNINYIMWRKSVLMMSSLIIADFLVQYLTLLSLHTITVLPLTTVYCVSETDMGSSTCTSECA